MSERTAVEVEVIHAWNKGMLRLKWAVGIHNWWVAAKMGSLGSGKRGR